jgi:hypothetical protein
MTKYDQEVQDALLAAKAAFDGLVIPEGPASPDDGAWVEDGLVYVQARGRTAVMSLETYEALRAPEKPCGASEGLDDPRDL